MKKTALIVFVLFLHSFLPFNVVTAENIVLEPGESYNTPDLEIMCVEKRRAREPVVIKDCQFWDDYNEKCLFERKTYVFNGLECIEECQYWDRYKKSCEFATSCDFHSSQKIFMLKKCALFDSYDHKCKRVEEILVKRKKNHRGR